MNKYILKLKKEKNFSSGILWNLTNTAAQAVFGMLQTLIYSRLISPNEFGALAVLFSFSYLIAPINSLGLANALSRSQFDPKLKNYKIVAKFALTITCILTTFQIFLMQFFLTGETQTHFSQISLLASAFALRELNSILWTVKGLFRELFLQNTINSLIAIIIPIILFTNFNFSILSMYCVTSFIVYCFALFLTISRQKSFKTHRNSEIFYAMKISLWILPHTISIVLISNLDRVVLSALIANDQIAIYFLSFQFANLLFLSINSINISYARAENTLDRTRHISRYLTRRYKLDFLILVTAIFMTVIEIVFIKLGLPEFYNQSTTYFIVFILNISSVFQIDYLMSINLLFRFKNFKHLRILTPATFVLNLVLMIFLTIEFQIIGTCLAFLIGKILLSVFVRRLLKSNSLK